MDPISHGLLGAAAAQSVARHSRIKIAAFIGLISAMTPDLDIFIKSDTNPLLALYYHRHFTHSLIFIPLAALILAPFFWLIFRKKISFLETYILCFVAYGTHSFLDSATSYGNLLFWPFSEKRVAWDLISIIDPIFTGLLLIAVMLGVFLYSYRAVIIFLSLAILYIGFGFYQHAMVKKEAVKIIRERGHEVEKIRAMPSLGNVILWRVVYISRGYIYSDAIRYTPISGAKIYAGEGRVKHLKISDINGLRKNSATYSDIEFFNHFSDGFIGYIDGNNNLIGDYRYSYMPGEKRPIWGIKFNRAAQEEHVEFIRFERNPETQFKELWQMIKGD